MFAVIYTFKVKTGREEEFQESWEELTRLIYKHEGSLGSRLHLNGDGSFVAYAQWPDKKTWEQAGSHLPPQADKHKATMHDCCEEIKTAFELNLLTDLLKPS